MPVLSNFTAGRFNLLYQKIAEARKGKLNYILLAGVALFITGILLMLHNTIKKQLLQAERYEKTVQTMLSLAEKQALTVKVLQVGDPLRAIKERAAKANMPLRIITSEKQQVRLRISETTLTAFMDWAEQLNRATGIQLSQVVLLPAGNRHPVQVEALLVWEVGHDVNV